jgi:hypothetical protein
MNFKQATDRLFDRIDHRQLADALRVSISSIRQARLSPTAKAYREPPPNWQDAVIRLAEKRMSHYRQLIGQLRERV